MRDVQIDDDTYARLAVAAKLTDESVGGVVRRLVNRLTDEPPENPGASAVSVGNGKPLPGSGGGQTAPIATEWVAIYKVYKGHRLEGTFNPRTHEVRLSTPPWSNKVFSSPTAAAVTVVDHFSGDVRESPNTNGRKFWKLADTGKNLHSIIGER